VPRCGGSGVGLGPIADDQLEGELTAWNSHRGLLRPQPMILVYL